MALMMRQLYQALRAAGAPDDEAAKAAEEVAQYENRIANIGSRLAVLQWMIGFNIALTVAIAVKLFVH
jgi:hypothetical protein